jgi:DNA processing protein
MTATSNVDLLAQAVTAKGFGPDQLDDDTFARLVLTTINGTTNGHDGDVGRLVADHGAAEALRLIVDGDDDELEAQNIRPIVDALRTPIRSADAIANTIAGALHMRDAGAIELLTPEHENWPRALSDLRSAAPLMLWARGDLEVLNNWRTTCVVGARAATGYGEHVAMELSSDLTFRDQIIVNGGAYGIEGMALRGSLAGGGTPIAVMAGGLNRLYPTGHEALLTRVADHGVLLSEQMPDAPPTRWRFQQANRMKAALAHSTIVVEAGVRSGAVQAALQAQLLGRFVGAVPGPITSAASAGCHQLLKDGTAHVVTAVNDIPAVANDPSIGPMRRHDITRAATTEHEAAAQTAQHSRSV